MRRGVNARTGLSHRTELVAVASAYPERSVSNEEYMRLAAFEPSDGWGRIEEQSGFRKRRWCGPSENSASLMRTAVAELQQRYPAAVAEVDAVVVASGTTMPVVLGVSVTNPAAADLAPLVLQQLGSAEAMGLDIKACYCTGFLRGLEVADGLLANPNRRAVMVVAVEQGSRLATAESNRSSFCFMIGDAAGAAILRRGDASGSPGLVDYCGHTDAAKLDWVGIGADARSVIMKGSQAGEASLELFVECGRTLLSRNGLSPADVRWLLPLQTHRGLVTQIAEALSWDSDSLLWDSADLGFSGSSSIPACLADQVHAAVVKHGDLVLALAVGAGLNCAGALFYC